jgi:hypothetical protein
LTQRFKKARNIADASFTLEEIMKTIHFTFLFFIMAASLTPLQTSHAQEAAKPAEPPKAVPKGPAEKTFPLDFDPVWNKVVEVLTEKGLSEHPHGKMNASKETGKITTPSFRYFKIFSAKPVVENHYRDTYTITISQEAAVKEKAAKAKDGEAKFSAEEAKTKAEEAKTKTGDEAKALLEEAKTAAEDAKKAEAEAKKLFEEAKVAATKPKATKLSIDRKFEIHDDVNRRWVDADPNKDKVGMSAEFLLNTIEGKLASATPGENVKLESIVKPNLNLTPPVIVEGDGKGPAVAAAPAPAAPPAAQVPAAPPAAAAPAK